MNNEPCLLLLRKYGAEHLLTADELRSIDGVQLTAQVDKPLNLYVRVRSGDVVYNKMFDEIDGVWKEHTNG